MPEDQRERVWIVRIDTAIQGVYALQDKAKAAAWDLHAERPERNVSVEERVVI